MADLFSVAALFILFRECLEASVIIAILLQMCRRLNMPKLRKQVWLGAITGILCSILVGVICIIIFYVAKNRIFQGNGKMIFKGFINLVAAFLITLVAFAMLKFKNYEKKWEVKLGNAASKAESRGKQTSVFFLAFSAVFREGIETVIFIAGISASTSVSAIPIPAIVGIIMGCAVGIFLYYTGRQIKDIAWFFYICCALLFLISAGLTASALNAWQSIGWYGTWIPVGARPWQNEILWDWSGCCSSDINQNRFFGLVNAIFGYQSQVTPIQLFAYFGYFVELGLVFVAKSKKGRLLDAMHKHRNKGAAPSALDPLPIVKDDDAEAPTPLPVPKGDLEL
ncbi:hypothetical protein WJX72_011512 [[Myrmecia] bisecta]|uniref:Iron permease FTR1 n=1 Tax=[Myrmecia] bisecta TaxID=41462 RepID=A0AAW1PLL8_9CHLO